MKRLERQGYGSSFNELFIKEETIQKVTKNEYGRKKIEKEKAFFHFIRSVAVNFPIPEQFVDEQNGYSMKYYRGWNPLFQQLQQTPEKLSFFLSKVYTCLESLHTSFTVPVTKETVKSDLQYELIEKIKGRYEEVKAVLSPYSFVRTVNGVSLETYDTLFSFFQEEIDRFVDSRQDFTYCPIHGDCQFNNILVSRNDELLFIDPRGSFGSSNLYGLKEYDTAKVCFALTGYDIFDSSVIDILDISGSNLTLPEIALDLSVLYSNEFTAILTASIWLGNPHSFKEYPLKAVYSYYYGLYVATLVYRRVKSLIK